MPASLSGLFPGLIDSLASGHSFLFEELSVPLGSRPRGASGSARERENLQRKSSPSGRRAPLCLLPSNSPD